MKWDAFVHQVTILFDALWHRSLEQETDIDKQHLKTYNHKDLELRILQQESFNYQKGFDTFQKRIQVNRNISLYRYLGIALSLVLCFTCSIVYYFFKIEAPIAIVYNDQKIIKPGDKLAILELSDGTIHQLDTNISSITDKHGMRMTTDSLGLRYAFTEKNTSNINERHTITVPRGAEYYIELHDGSKVWLNSDSKFIYPKYFPHKRREVTLLGEGFFAITKQQDSPFIINTDQGKIEVLGTSFNVRCYEKSNQVIVTLVEGSVHFYTTSNDKIRIYPNQQLTVANNNFYKVKEVDPQFAISWKIGRFKFHEARLEQILEQLARWYDIHLFYTDEHLKDLRFSGDLSRYKTIDVFLDMLQRSSNIKLVLNGNTLIISR